MVRTIKEYEERKNELLDTAQQLFFIKGYNQTSVEAIINQAGVSKGTFYYYFKSKEDLLDKLVERLSKKIIFELRNMVEREDLNAFEKLNQAFEITRNLKMENIDLVQTAMQFYYEEKNLLFRHKINANSIKLFVPEFIKIINQGMKEKSFDTLFPEEAARLILDLAVDLSESMPALILELEQNPENFVKIERTMKSYENAIERIIGAEKGTVHIVDRKILKLFYKKIKT
jgi:AcrR family transcriptional regulator